MRLGFNGATTQTADLATDIRVAGQAGYDVIELRDNKLDQFLAQGSLDDVSRMLREAGVAAWTINAIDRVGVDGAASTARAVARCRELSRYAQAIECPWVLVVPGTTEGRTDAQVTSDTVAALRDMADAASEFGISVAFEFMGFPWAAVRDVAGAWAIVQGANRPNLGIIVDTAHSYAGGSTLESFREVDPERLVVLHINDVEDVAKPDITDGHRLYPGEGVIPLQDILGAVRATGWDGVLSVELFREEYWRQDPLAVAREAKARTVAVWERVLRRGGSAWPRCS
jgi:2-keto-myo-inositol isomerase